MAQHIPIEQFDQKAMQKLARSIRGVKYFAGSLKFEELREADYKETPEDRVFVTYRAVPKSILWFKPCIEVHTKPAKMGREATNIYVVA